MKACSAAAIFVAANAVDVNQYNYNSFIFNPEAYRGTYSGRYNAEGYGVLVEPVIQREYIPQIVPVCPRICAKAKIVDNWEGDLADGQFGTNGEMTFEANCNSKRTTIRGKFENLAVRADISPGGDDNRPAPGTRQTYTLTINDSTPHKDRGAFENDARTIFSSNLGPVCQNELARSLVTIGDITEDRNDKAKFFTKSDEVELFGEDSVIGKSIVLTAAGHYDNDQRVACGVIEEVECRSLY